MASKTTLKVKIVVVEVVTDGVVAEVAVMVWVLVAVSWA